MRLDIKGGKKIVLSGFYRQAEVPILCIITALRGVYYDSLSNEGDRIVWEYISYDKKFTEQVILVSESDEDLEVLKCIRYENHEDEQLCIVFVKKEFEVEITL